MNTEAIKEIAEQLGIAANAVTKDVIPAYTSYMIASNISKIIALAFAIIALLTLGRFFIFKSKEYADWENKKLTQYQRNEMRDNYEDFVLAGITCYACSIGLAIVLQIVFARAIPWILSPYGAFLNLLMPH